MGLLQESEGRSQILSVCTVDFDRSDQLFLVIMSFLLYRFFDITKFLGINKIEKLNGSLGIMLDDIVAGFYTLIIVILIKIFLV